MYTALYLPSTLLRIIFKKDYSQLLKFHRTYEFENQNFILFVITSLFLVRNTFQKFDPELKTIVTVSLIMYKS